MLRFNLPETLTDGILVLNAHRLEDAEAHLEGEDEEMRRRFDAVRPATIDETRQAMIRWIEGRAAGAPVYAFAVRLPDGRLVGGCELRIRSRGTASISYWIFPQFRQRGYATRSLSLLLSAVAGAAGLDRLEIRVEPDNVASRRVAEKAAFEEAGLVEQIALTGARSTVILFTRLLGQSIEEH